MKHVLIGIALAIVGFACGQAAVQFGQPDDYQPIDLSDGGTPSDGGTTVSGLPCDVATLVQAQCVSCHSNPPVSLAPMPLVTREDFLAVRAGGKTAGQLSVERMKNASLPMPPGNKLGDADIALMENWVNDGMKAGSCESNNDGPRPIDPSTPATCTSGTWWRGGDHGDRDMHPGRACIECHTDRREGPSLKIAGTVYPSVHEPDDCNSGGKDDDPMLAVVEIIDANGKSTNFTPRASGNFSDWKKATSITFPIRARVHYKDKTRVMATAVTTGDCNSCHTQYGAENAPGRIVLP